MAIIEIRGDNSPAGILKHWERRTKSECAREILRCWNRIAELEAARDNAIQQARIWKQEATTQRATVAECYRAVTGNAGEPGDWNGANPVRDKLAELKSEVERLRKSDQWVRCSEQLPKDTQVYQLYCKDTKEQFVGFHIGDGRFQYGEYKDSVTNIALVCRPSHYAPLGKPPAPEGE